MALLPAEKPALVEAVPDSYIAVLSDPKTQRPVLVATATRQDARLSVRAIDNAILVSDRSLELWAVPAKGGPRSLGLVGMSERARKVGGTLRITSRAGQGTRVLLTLPLDLTS